MWEERRRESERRRETDSGEDEGTSERKGKEKASKIVRLHECGSLSTSAIDERVYRHNDDDENSPAYLLFWQLFLFQLPTGI